MKDIINVLENDDFTKFSEIMKTKLDEKLLNNKVVQEVGSVVKHYDSIKKSFSQIKA